MLEQLKNSILARNTLWVMLGHGLRYASQAAYFIIITRSLGVEGFGAFASVLALVMALSAFSTLGTNTLIIKNASRDALLFRRYWGNALAVTLFMGPVLVIMLLLVYPYVFPASVSFLLVLSIALADLICSRMLHICIDTFLAFQRTGWTAFFEVLLSLTRLGSAVGMSLLITSPSPQEWGLLYLLSTAFSALVGIWIVCRKFGTPEFNLSNVRPELKEGFLFSVSFSSDRFHEDIDKTMLARLSTLDAAGIYAAAYRVIDLSFAPMRALLYASYARFFQHGVSGISGTLNYTKRLLPYAATYSLFAAVVLYLAAPLLPLLLGDDFQSSVEAVRWLAILPFLRAIQYFAAETLTGAGLQGFRSSVQVLVVFFNVLANFLLIPVYSWRGAALASLVSEALLLLGLWGLVWYLSQKKRV